MIKKFSINILKILSSVLISAILIICVGLWRLSEAPLQLRSEIINRLIKVENVKYGDVFLENPNLSASPTVVVYDAQFSNDDIDIKTEKIKANWDIFKILYGKLSISSLQIFKPDISVHYSPQTFGKNQAVPVPQSISTLQNLLEKSWLPAENIIIKNACVKFYKKRKKVGEIKDITFQYSTTKKVSTGFLEIYPSKGVNPIVLSTVYHRDHNLLNYKLNAKNFLLKESYLPYRFRPYLNKFKYSTKAPFNITSEGNIGVSNKGLNGLLKSTISFVLEPDAKDKIQLSIDNNFSVQTDEIKIHTEAKAQEFDWAYLSTLWPEGLGAAARSWVLKNMVGGQATNSKISFDIAYTPKNNTLDIQNLGGTVGVKNTELSYLGDLPKIKNTSALATFNKKSFDIKIIEGSALNLKITGGNVLLYELGSNEKASLNLTIQGPIKDALNLVNQKPLEFIKAYPIKPADFGGNAKINLKLDFPLKSGLVPAEVKSITNADIIDLDYTHAITDKKIGLFAKALKLNITNEGLTLAGNCEIDGYPGEIQWKESFKKTSSDLRTFKINADLPFRTLATYCPESIKNFISKKEIISSQGISKVLLNFTQKNETASSLTLDIDLSNNTFDIIPIRVRIPKAKDHYFKAVFDFDNGNLKSIKPFIFNTSAVKIEGSTKHKKDGSVEDIELKEIKVKDNHIQISGHLKNHLLKLNAAAKELNLFSVIDQLKTQNTSQGTYKFKSNINAKISKLIMKDSIEIPNVVIQSVYNQNDLEKIIMTSKEKDTTFFDLYYGPKENKIVFELKSDAMGTLLSAFDISKDIQADLLYTKAEKLKGSTAPMKGHLKVKSLRVKNASILAKLFSLMSFESLLTNLTGQGILFIKGDAEYEYKDKKIAITQAELTSSGIGLTTQGYIDIDKNLLDLYGVIIPANLFNQAITGIPLIGNLLTGGETNSGIISTSYTIKGTTSDPKVNANPLSVLAPTLVRRIFSGVFGAEKKEIGIRNFPALEPNNKKVEKVN